MTVPYNGSAQDGLFPPEQARSVTLIGAGSVGSWVALQLACIGVTDLTVYDGDSVESHNVPMSVYGLDDVGSFKVTALARVILAKTGIVTKAIPRHYQKERLPPGAVILCVDDMDERRRIWETRVRGNPNLYLVETRTHEHSLEVFCIRPWDDADCAFYESLLYPQSTAERPTCGHHGIIYVAARAATQVVASLANHWSGSTPRRHEKELLAPDGYHRFQF